MLFSPWMEPKPAIPACQGANASRCPSQRPVWSLLGRPEKVWLFFADLEEWDATDECVPAPDLEDLSQEGLLRMSKQLPSFPHSGQRGGAPSVSSPNKIQKRRPAVNLTWIDKKVT